jgi:hypothetical protein
VCVCERVFICVCMCVNISIIVLYLCVCVCVWYLVWYGDVGYVWCATIQHMSVYHLVHALVLAVDFHVLAVDLLMLQDDLLPQFQLVVFVMAM